MKTNVKRFSKRTLAMFLGVLMLVTSLGFGTLITVNANNGNVTNFDVYFKPYASGSDGGGWIKDNKTIGARYCYGDNNWQSATGSDTGRTQGGQRVYKVTLQEKYGGLDHLYFRHNDLENSTDNEMHAVNGWWELNNYSGKYYNGSSWATLSYDTIKVRNSTTDVATLSFNSTTKKFTGSATLNAGTTYKLNIYDGGRYWANSGAGTITSTATKSMYRYGSGGSTDGVTIKPEVTGTYSFEWSLATAGGREDEGSFKITYPTIYTVSYTLGSNVSYSSVTGGTKTANGTIKAASGSNVALTVSYATNYTYDSSTSTLNGATASNSNQTFTFSSISANKSITINAKSSLTALTAPSITYGGSSNATQSMNASKGSKARIAWSAVSNAGSYEVFKGGVSQGTTTNLYYDIERGNSYGGAYTVKAVPSDATSYTTSAASNSITFTFNKVAQPAPTVTGGSKTIDSGTVAYTLSGGTGTLGTDFKYQHSGANNTSYSDVTNSSWTTSSMTTAGNYVYKFKTVALATDYYTDSSSVTSDTITVRTAYQLRYYDNASATGTFADSSSSTKAFTYDSAANAYYANVTVTNLSKFYYRIKTTNLSSDKLYAADWNNGYPNVYDVAVGGSKVNANTDVTSWDNKASLHYSGDSPKIIVWYDGSKTWITDNAVKHNVTITQPSNGTIKVEDATTSPQQFYEDDSVDFTVTANSGYVITSVTVGGTTTSVDRAASYVGSFTLTGNTAISATIVREYSITASSATGGTYTVKRGSTAVTKFIVGDSLTLTPSPSTHYNFTNFTISGGKTATLTANPSTLDTTGATGNITITPTWTAKSYNVSVEAKYTNNASSTVNDFNQTFDTPPAVTIASGTATNPTGVAVTAPGTDPSGYQWVGWKTANGSFTNATNKDTTFKPNANNAKAVACYKKIHTITVSVDPSGTGAGTATTSVNSVAAGGSYTITSTVANSYSAIESVKVNGTSKGANATTEVSSVSGDQTVLVKFKSRVLLKGDSTINATAWAGENMQANAAGTSFSITKTLDIGNHDFRLYSNDAWKANNVADWVLNGIGTNSEDSGNIRLNLTSKADVTFISDGTKFTSITAIPYGSSKVNVTLANVSGATTTAEYMGVEYTSTGSNIIQVYSGTELNFTVTAASGKYISALSGGTFSPAFAVADTYTGKIASVTAATTITPTVGTKIAITAKTNKSKLGTVSVSPSSARPGETVTITLTEKNGVYKTGTLSAKKANGDSITVTPSRAVLTSTFTMPDSPVTVSADFAPYSAESNWYYNGYNTDGSKVAAYHSKQMTEGMVGGQKFSYYHVEGRTGDDQLMTVSDGRIADTRYVYFTRPKNFSYWNQSNSPKAHFWKNGGSDYDTWPGNTMTWVYDNDMGEAVFKIAIPVGADRVSFNDASNNGQQQTVDIDLTNTSGAYYVSGWNDSANKYNYGTWNTSYDDQGWIASGTEYWYQNADYNGDYTADFSTKGFFNHYASSKEFAKPKDLGDKKGDYYVNVLYPSTSYTINGVTKTTGSNPMIIWTTEPLAGDEDVVKVYAKDGAIRSETYGSTYANIADTQIVSSASSTTSIGTNQSGNISGQTYETYNAAQGETIYILTTINTTAGNGADTTSNRNKYYVRGFCINGEVYELKEWVSSGEYRTSYKIPEDYEGKIEITPIYYLRNTTAHPIVTFRVTSFPKDKYGWGDTLYAYPFYGKLGSNNNAFGAYPGQPLVYYKGQYQIQIPQQSTAWDVYLSDSALSGTNSEKKTQVAGTNVSGITMSNGYYDLVHRQVMGYGDNSASADHVQTYDYGDFYKIFNEKENIDNIVFDFKYETSKDNRETLGNTNSYTKATLNSTFTNGFELLTNFHGRTVDLFGTPLSGDAADTSKTPPLYVVSIGGPNGSSGVSNIAGYYATEWAVFKTSATTVADSNSYTRVTATKTSIPPEVLVLNDDDNTSFNTTTYPSAVSGQNITDWKALYTALEAYRGVPVMITYESAQVQIGDSNFNKTGGGGATRNDGRWLYSKTGESITSKIRVDVSTDNGVTYTENPASGQSGHIDDLEAYFTNAEVDEGATTFSTTIDPDKTFDFEAHSNNADYKFMGWYMEDGTKITTDNIAETERSGSYTFVARFMYFEGGQLILGHKAVTDTTYKGAGTATIAVTVKNGDEVVREIAATSADVTLDDKIINNANTAYTIEVTLNAAGTGEDTYARTTCDKANTFFGGQSAYTSMPQTFSFTVGSLFTGSSLTTKKITYNSYFNKVQYTYNFTFSYRGREGSSNQSFQKSGTLTAAQREAYVTGTGAEDRVLTEAFMNKIAPYESNFNTSYKWDFSDSADRTFTKNSASSYSITNVFTATVDESEGTKSEARTVTFKLPFAYDSYGHATDAGTMNKTTQADFVVNVNYGKAVKKPYPNSTIEKQYADNPNDLSRFTYYVTAPRYLRVTENNTTTTKAFQYWNIYKASDTGMTKVIAKCYYESFNYIAYDSYIVEPYYAGDTKASEGPNATTASINYLETSRNQWNNGGNGGKIISNANADEASDILYSDFQLAYTLADGTDVKYSPSTVKAGLVVQQLDKLDTNQDGSVITDLDHYESKYSEISAGDLTTITTFAKNGSNSSTLKLARYSINKSNLDNKDMMDYCYRQYNSIGDSDKTEYTNKNYVYRAFACIVVDGVVTLSEKPVYFTIAQEANK